MAYCNYRCHRKVAMWRPLPGGVRQCIRCALRAWWRRSPWSGVLLYLGVMAVAAGIISWAVLR